LPSHAGNQLGGCDLILACWSTWRPFLSRFAIVVTHPFLCSTFILHMLSRSFVAIRSRAVSTVDLFKESVPSDSRSFLATGMIVFMLSWW
jgi:hypothetical protein